MIKQITKPERLYRNQLEKKSLTNISYGKEKNCSFGR
jgi:hypothetical protein